MTSQQSSALGRSKRATIISNSAYRTTPIVTLQMRLDKTHDQQDSTAFDPGASIDLHKHNCERA
ncbi:hypothetical protein [Sinorhizobium psoraleae]|uniref:hypothetical protein n=1 Tax=Sinorhizobium psoraleae TaxID=520838 RepID=UPI0022AF5253|nr:hypothetical protein [Sinorhizobium psoraleae]